MPEIEKIVTSIARSEMRVNNAVKVDVNRLGINQARRRGIDDRWLRGWSQACRAVRLYELTYELRPSELRSNISTTGSRDIAKTPLLFDISSSREIRLMHTRHSHVVSIRH